MMDQRGDEERRPVLPPGPVENLSDLLAGPRINWEYNMRRSMQEIIPHLYLGPYSAATRSSFDNLAREGITHIVCVRTAAEGTYIRANFPDHFQYLVLDLGETVQENIISAFPDVCEFLDQALSINGRVLLHGNAGISRSGALLTAYIMRRHGLGYTDALSVIQSRRLCVYPHEIFCRQLREREPIFLAEAMIAAHADEPDLRREIRKRGGHRARDEEEEEEGAAMATPYLHQLPQGMDMGMGMFTHGSTAKHMRRG